MKKHIVFIIPSLGGGGAERVFLNLLNKLDKNFFKLSLIIITNRRKYNQEFSSDINVYSLNKKRVRQSFLDIVKIINKIEPDIIFSTLSHLNIMILMIRSFFPKKIKVIVRESSIVSEIIKNSKYKSIWSILYKIFYNKADKIVCQSKYMQYDLWSNFNIDKRKTIQIYNPVDIEKVDYLSKEVNFNLNKSEINMVFIGRLEEVKNVNYIISKFSSFVNSYPKASLWILGEGRLENTLKSLCQSLGIADNVKFVGFQSNPFKWLANADLCLFASEYEGFPNVLLEAVSVDCPILVRQHPGGTREIMEITGQLNRFVEDFDWKQEIFQKPNQQAKLLLRKNFAANHIVEKYETVFREVLE